MRHVHTSVERTAGLVVQVGASLRSRNADRREDGLVQLQEIAGARGRPHLERALVRDVRDGTA